MKQISIDKLIPGKTYLVDNKKVVFLNKTQNNILCRVNVSDFNYGCNFSRIAPPENFPVSSLHNPACYEEFGCVLNSLLFADNQDSKAITCKYNTAFHELAQ